MKERPVDERVGALPWDALVRDIDTNGYAVSATPVLDAAECAAIVDGFDDDVNFRSSVDMGRHRFGSGTYRYYDYPLPPVVEAIRVAAYPPLARLANRWSERTDTIARYPARLDEYLDDCHAHGQTRATPLVLRYTAGDWNALHQDLYGDLAFPLQVTVGLSTPVVDFTGGENVLVEQRPRAQSRPISITIPRGHALFFPNRYRPVANKGKDRPTRMTVRHGVSAVTSGARYVLGVIFHDAT